MNRQQAFAMQATAWVELDKLTHQLCRVEKTAEEALPEIQAWTLLHAAASRVIDSIPSGNDYENLLDATKVALAWADELIADGGLTRANAMEVWEHITEVLDQLEG